MIPAPEDEPHMSNVGGGGIFNVDCKEDGSP